MVLYMTTGNFMLSLVVSVVFIYGMKMLSGLKEGMFGDLKVPDLTSGTPFGASGLPRGPPRDLPGPFGPFGPSGPLSFVGKVSGAVSRQVIINDAKNRDLTHYETKTFKNNMDNNLLNDTIKWIRENNIDLFKGGVHNNVNQLLCVALFNTMIKGVIFGNDYKGNLTDKDINDAKKIRTAMLFKDRYGYTDLNTGEEKMVFTCGERDTGRHGLPAHYYEKDLECNFFGKLYEAIKHFTKSSPDLQQDYLDDLAKVSNGSDLSWCDWYKYDKSIN